MINNNFEVYKLSRELARSGRSFIFKRVSKNYFGEETDEINVSCTVVGLYHEQNSYISVNSGETTFYRTKKVPMILCLYSDVSQLNVGDYFEKDNQKYKVTGITNVQNWDKIADVSLEISDVI